MVKRILAKGQHENNGKVKRQKEGKVEPPPSNGVVEATTPPLTTVSGPGPDPFDPATYRVHVSLEAAAGVEQVLTGITVRTPNKAWWVRRHPSPDFAMRAWVLELKEEQETYLVLPHLWPSLAGEATFKPKALYLATTMQGHPFIWPVRCPVDETRLPDKWMLAPLEAVRLAAEKWVRVAWNEATRQHDVLTCASAVEPQWPNRPFRDLLELAFKGFVIDTPTHPVLRRLRGEGL
jgi:hypothetical protein